MRPSRALTGLSLTALVTWSCGIVGLERKELVDASVASDAGEAGDAPEEFPPEPSDCKEVDPRYQSARWPAQPEGLDGANYVIDDAAGTVLDRITGLMWQRAAGTEASFDDAKCACTALVLGGYPDWRMPSFVELSTIADYAKNVDPKGNGTFEPATNLTAFPDMRIDAYWTSTTAAGAGYVNSINFINGRGNTQLGREGFNPYRCVRTARRMVEVSPRFSVAGGLVTDAVTSLEWAQTSPAEMPYDTAFGYCLTLTVSGKRGFHMPSIREYVTLLDYARTKPPYVDKAVFPGVADAFLSSTRYGADPKSLVWSVSTFGANLVPVSANDKTSVLCVRKP